MRISSGGGIAFYSLYPAGRRYFDISSIANLVMPGSAAYWRHGRYRRGNIWRISSTQIFYVHTGFDERDRVYVQMFDDGVSRWTAQPV